MRDASPHTSTRSWHLSLRNGSDRHVLIKPWMLLPVVLFIVSFAINLAHVDSTEFHPDETRWINRAHYFTDLSHPFGPTWEDQYLTRGQPPLGSYLMGLGLVIQGRDTDTNRVWDFAYGAEWNRINGAMPETEDLEAARRMNAFVGAVTVVLVFFVGHALLGLIAGVAGALLLALHPLHIWVSSQAISDQLLILLVAVSLLVASRLGRRPSRASAVGLGILLGLGGATKLSPLLLAFPIAFYGAALVALARSGVIRSRHAERLGFYLLWQPVIAMATFVLVYPYLWPRPIARAWSLFALRSEEMDEQSAAWPTAAVEHPGVAVARIFDRLTWEFSTTGDVVQGVSGWLGFATEPPGIDIPIAIVGAGILAWLSIKRGLDSGTALAALVLAGQMAAIILGMKVDFYRYHLPVALGICVLGGLAIHMLWQQLAARGAWRVWNIIPGVTVADPNLASEERAGSPDGTSTGSRQSLQTGRQQ